MDQPEFQQLIHVGVLTGARALLNQHSNGVLVSKTIRRIELQMQLAGAQRVGDSVMPVGDTVRYDNIPKTVIYMEAIQEMECARNFLIRCLIKAGIKARSACKIIQVYYADLADNDKYRISTEFATVGSRIRIVLATEALGVWTYSRRI